MLPLLHAAYLKLLVFLVWIYRCTKHHSPEQENLGHKYDFRPSPELMIYAPTLVEMGIPTTLRVGPTGLYTRSQNQLLSAV